MKSRPFIRPCSVASGDWDLVTNGLYQDPRAMGFLLAPKRGEGESIHHPDCGSWYFPGHFFDFTHRHPPAIHGPGSGKNILSILERFLCVKHHGTKPCQLLTELTPSRTPAVCRCAPRKTPSSAWKRTAGSPKPLG